MKRIWFRIRHGKYVRELYDIHRFITFMIGLERWGMEVANHACAIFIDLESLPRIRLFTKD